MFFGNRFRKLYSHIESNDPFPEIEIEILNCFRDNKLTKDNFTIDTGASTTSINEEIFDILDLEYHGMFTIEYGDADIIERDTCLINLRLPQIDFEEKRLEVAIHERGTENLLGRDILNKLSLFLYGQKRMFKIKN